MTDLLERLRESLADRYGVEREVVAVKVRHPQLAP